MNAEQCQEQQDLSPSLARTNRSEQLRLNRIMQASMRVRALPQVCDGAAPMFRNAQLAVIGGGDTAMEEAQFLTRYGAKVSPEL